MELYVHTRFYIAATLHICIAYNTQLANIAAAQLTHSIYAHLLAGPSLL